MKTMYSKPILSYQLFHLGPSLPALIIGIQQRRYVVKVLDGRRSQVAKGHLGWA